MKEKIALTSIIANAILAGGKILVGLISYSSAILAEGIHSLMDIFSSLISYLGIKMAQKPADQSHPYGHYKFEVLAGVIITLILLLTGLGIIYEAGEKIIHPASVRIGYLAFGVMIFAAVVNEIMARLKIYYGKKENSISLLSDGIHSRVDVLASLIVLVGLFLIKYWIYADSVLAIFVGLYIIKESFSLGKEAIDSLLDTAASPETEEKIKSITQEIGIEINSLRTQKKGSVITANLEIKLPNNLKVEEATKISEKLRQKLMEEIDNLVYVGIQVTNYETEVSFYRPRLGRSFGWQRLGQMKNRERKDRKGLGPDGYCVCPQCNYRIPHQQGISCSSLRCPNCGTNLKREK